MSTRDVVRDAHAVMLAAFRGSRVPGWLPGAYERGLGGICLYGDNVDPVHGLVPLARHVAALDPSAILAADEEGGDVTRLHMDTGSPAPGNAALGTVDDLHLTRLVAAGIGAELRDAGIWLDLAPCADVASNPANPVIGTRSFGADPALVARHVSAFIDGLADQAVAAAVKHFPGHGDTSVDSHLGLPRVTADAAVLQARELVPFRAAVDAGVATIMTSHVVLEALDPDRPATLSPAVLTGLLRGQLGFDGVIVTDALDMAGASAMLGIDGAAVAALVAGADLLCLGPEQTDSPAALDLAVRGVAAAVADGTLLRDRLGEAARRVGRLRAHWAERSVPSASRRAALEAAADASRTVAAAAIGRLDVPVLDARATVVRLDTGTNPAVGSTGWGRLDLPGHRVDLDATELDDTALIDGPVVIVARRADADPTAWSWVQRQLASDSRNLLVDLGAPSPGYAGRRDVIVTGGSSPALAEALSRALGGGR